MYSELKPFDSGLVVGRFQTFHRGHERLIETGLLLCDRLLILVGSAQESGTKRNPYDVYTRIKMIQNIYGPNNPRIKIHALTDLTNENNITYDWGRYLLDNTKRYLYKNPEVMIYGNDESRSNWFDKKDLQKVTEVIINRYDKDYLVSGTMLRELMIKDDRETWMKHTNPKLHKMYDELRSELLSVPFYSEMKNSFLKI